MVMLHQTRRMGGKPPVHDPRVPPMSARMNLATLPPPPLFANWYAAQAAGGVPLLGNGHVSNCVQCSVTHYLATVSRYVHPTAPLIPSEAETIAMYSAVTGYDPNNPATDRGTYFLGSQGMVQYWAQHGVTVGGVLNKISGAVTVDFTNRIRLKQAVALFGYVFTAAQMREADMNASFVFNIGTSPIVGYHEFLICGYNVIAGSIYWDIMTWEGMFRATDAWVTQAVRECVVVLDRAFVGANNISAADVAWADLENDMRSIALA
jgi:hypothetical protein